MWIIADKEEKCQPSERNDQGFGSPVILTGRGPARGGVYAGVTAKRSRQHTLPLATRLRVASILIRNCELYDALDLASPRFFFGTRLYGR
jgi:hypothetical protein